MLSLVVFWLSVAIGSAQAVLGIKVGGSRKGWWNRLGGFEPLSAEARLYSQGLAVVSAAILTISAYIGGNTLYVILEVFLVVSSLLYWMPRQYFKGVLIFRTILMLGVLCFCIWAIVIGRMQAWELFGVVGVEALGFAYLLSHEHHPKARAISLFVGSVFLAINGGLGMWLAPQQLLVHMNWFLLNIYFGWVSYVYWLDVKHK